MLPVTYTLNKHNGGGVLPADPRAKVTAAIHGGMLDSRLRVRDMNAYRTSYADMTQGRETHVKSNMPSGYGGNIPTIRHDVLHRNTQFHERLHELAHDPNRDTFGDFEANIQGISYVTKNPRVLGTNPTKGCFPTGFVVPPWAVLQPLRPLPNYVNAQVITKKTLELFGRDRSNAYHMTADGRNEAHHAS